MVKEYAEAWYRNREKLKNYYETHTQEQYAESYRDLLKTVIRIVINDPQKVLNEDGLIEHDSDDYQGDLIWLIPEANAWPWVDEYVFCHIDYGSCSGCDTLKGIYEGYGTDWGYGTGKLPDQQRVRDYMYLSLHLLQNMRPLITEEEYWADVQFDAKTYMEPEKKDG